MSHDVRPVLVTTAAKSPAQERRERERRYLITMGLRVVAIVAAIVFTRIFAHGAAYVISLTVSLTLALVLPWIGVVAANAGPKQRDRENPSLYAGERRRELR